MHKRYINLYEQYVQYTRTIVLNYSNLNLNLTYNLRISGLERLDFLGKNNVITPDVCVLNQVLRKRHFVDIDTIRVFGEDLILIHLKLT